MLVKFKLEKTVMGTLLTITEFGSNKIPSDCRNEAFLMNEKGWTEQLKNIEHHVCQKP